ncbi:MAG: carbon monoxide dehydrogenase [Alphaproteobacteria bacterium]|jgi:carbon-monoxide dehydrogenase medium subunit|nr:carbon monoxide dehydrogenase [Alphaproteobacteria bacterium]
MYAFDYHKPSSVADAVAALGKADDGKFMAGGQTLIPTLKQRLAMPSDVVDLRGIDEIKGICEEAGGLTIGAGTTHAEVATNPLVGSTIPGLAALAAHIGDAQVRHLGTLGGSIANNDPAADYPGAIVGLGATVRTSSREIAGDDFFTGMFETALAEDELIVSVHFPKPEAAAYAKFRNPASRYALVGAMVAKTGGGVRVAVTGAGPCVFRSAELEQALAADFSPGAVDGVSISADGLNGDIHASPEYRAHLIKVMAKRAVAAATGG